MAEDRQDLLPTPEMPQPNFAGSQPRAQGITCSRRGMISALSVFVALLVAGQAATVYFVVQQNGQITKLKDFTNEIKLKMLAERLPSSHPVPQKKQKMVMMDRPLRLFDPDEQPPRVNLTKLLNTATNSGKVEDHVKYMILKENPQRVLPEFNDTILENLNKLKISYRDEREWKDFESWMHKWLLFNSALHPSPEDSRAHTDERTPITEAPVLSKCQMEAGGSGTHDLLIGVFLPQCTDSGDYWPKQCHSSVGFCWCVYKNGTEIPGTRTRGRLDCNNFPDPEGSTLGLMDEDV